MRYPFSRKTRLIGLFVTTLILLAVGHKVFAIVEPEILPFIYNGNTYEETASFGYYNDTWICYCEDNENLQIDAGKNVGRNFSCGEGKKGLQYYCPSGNCGTPTYYPDGFGFNLLNPPYSDCFSNVNTIVSQNLLARFTENWAGQNCLGEITEGAIILEANWESGGIPPTPRIYGITPVSTTEIIDMNTEFTFGYKNLDWEEYKGFVINFRDLKLGVVSNSKQFLAEDLEPSGTGTEVVNLADFGIDTNGGWYLTGLAFGTHLDIEGGMFLTTRGYIDFWSDELVDPYYYLIFNVEGLATPYTFTDPNDWYTVNQDRFTTSTAFFLATTGFLTPLFENISDFAIRLQSMFNQSEAYDRGYSLGEIFPIINAYVEKIDWLFGGFPLTSFLTYIVLVMLAIFVVRAIFKFIPFFG